jgi:hypothetical protein
MKGDSQIASYAAMAAILAFVGAGIWWRVAGDPTTGGLIIVGAAAALVIGVATFALQSRRS